MGFSNARGWRLLDTVLSVLLLAFLLTANFSQMAYALDTAKCTARPNADTGSNVLGGVETRITWEGQAAPDEAIKGITLTMPEGTDFEVEDARLTLLSGDDLMTRENPECTFTKEGQAAVCSLAEIRLITNELFDALKDQIDPAFFK